MVTYYWHQLHTENLNPERMFRLGGQAKIDSFLRSFEESRRAIDQGVNLHAAIVATRMAAQVNQSCEFITLVCEGLLILPIRSEDTT